MQGSRRAPLTVRSPAWVFWPVVLATLVADQASKTFVRVLWSVPASVNPLDQLVGAVVSARFEPDASLPVFGEVLRITHVRNTGAAFGLFPGYQPFFIATSLVVLIVVAAYWRRAHPQWWPIVTALALVTGGAVGNLIDRALLGRVTDFFDVAMIGFPVFNIADSAIVVGVTILVLWLLFGPETEAVCAEEAPTDRRGETDEGVETENGGVA